MGVDVGEQVGVSASSASAAKRSTSLGVIGRGSDSGGVARVSLRRRSAMAVTIDSLTRSGGRRFWSASIAVPRREFHDSTPSADAILALPYREIGLV